jgi:uncharacterized membrane protein
MAMEINDNSTSINQTYGNEERLLEQNSTDSEPKIFASRNVNLLNNNSIFIKLADTDGNIINPDKNNEIQICNAITTATTQSKLALDNKSKKANKWLTISLFAPVIGLITLGAGILSGLCGTLGPVVTIGGPYIFTPFMNTVLLIMIACVTCAIAIGIFYLYSKDKHTNVLADFNNEKLNFESTIKLTYIVSDIFEFCDYADDTDEKQYRAGLFNQNIVTTLRNKETLQEMNSFLSLYNIIEKKAYYINSKIAKISKDNPLCQQQYEYIKMQGLQKISEYSIKLENSSKKLFGLIFSNLSNNLDQTDIKSIKQLQYDYIEQKLKDPSKTHKLFRTPLLGVTASKNTTKNNLENIQKDAQNIVMQAIMNGAKNSF